MKKVYLALLIVFVIVSCVVLTLSQSGGTFTISRSGIVTGAASSSGGSFSVSGTTGQPGGSTASGGTFQIGSGFWGGGSQPAASVSISGRIYTSDGVTGLRNATVSLTDALGTVRTVTTSTFGFYSFADVAPGNVYTIRIISRRFRYQPQAVLPAGDLANIDFIGLE